MSESDTNQITSPEKDAAKAQQRFCRICNLSGQVTIFHPKYDGAPTVEIRKYTGEIIQVPARIMAHCDCLVGKWMRDHTSESLRIRIPSLADTESRYSRWTVFDPTTPDIDVSQIPAGDIMAIARAVAAEMGQSVQRNLLKQVPEPVVQTEPVPF